MTDETPQQKPGLFLKVEQVAVTDGDGPQDLLALTFRQARDVFERTYLRQQLDACGGRVQELANRTGIERTHLYRKLRTLGVATFHSKKKPPADESETAHIQAATA